MWLHSCVCVYFYYPPETELYRRTTTLLRNSEARGAGGCRPSTDRQSRI